MIEIENPLEAYKEPGGPILLLAGPGTGKTYQLEKRIEYLINEVEANPNEITVITFTRETARNMRERLAEKDNIPKENHPEIISTMHSLGNSIIATYPELCGLREKYNVLTEDALKQIFLKDACILSGYEIEKWEITKKCRINGDCNENPQSEKCQICSKYKEILLKSSLIDYDDQIFLACKILRENNEIKEEWQRKTKYLLVDEYQDINQAQYDLIRLLCERQEDGLFVVGDDEQSIYSFRGGNPKFIVNFEEYFGENAKIGRLSKNWRCPEHILKGAKSMVEKYYTDGARKPEPAFDASIEFNNKIKFYDIPSGDYEAWKIADIAKNKVKTDKMIIIIPNKNYLPPIKKALKRNNIDYKCKVSFDDEGLIRFNILHDWLENPDNNLMMRYLLDLIINNHDELSNLINVESDRLTAKRLKASELIAKMWENVSEDKSLYKVLTEVSSEDQSEYFGRLNKTLKEIIELISENGNSRKGITPFLEKCGLIIAPGKTPFGIMSEVKDWMNELIGTLKSSSYDPVEIYSMQSSKGLEANIVFVIGVSHEIFPDPRLDIKEQSRLFFVAMTRAKKELYLFSARTRSANITFGRSFQIQKSEFIDAIANDHIDYDYIRPRR